MYIKQRGEGGNVIHLIELLATDHFLITCLYSRYLVQGMLIGWNALCSYRV